ncbi:MAG: pyruvate formate lyase-activating protein [Treponema sp.]|nr:pyruvate formate lyase-activating protein [Treponema sp.]
MSVGFVHSIESCGAVDGPGVRYIIFLSGCPMRCLFCHNPDTWEIGKGEKREPLGLIEEALSCRSYWGKKGGITVSGGEPLVQIDFLTELFTIAKEKGITTCIDTAGGPFSRNPAWLSKFEKLCSLTDTFLMDIKIIDPEKHKALTGLGNENIIDMFRYLDEKKKDVWIRHVLVPGWSDNDEYLTKTRDFIRTLSNIKRVEILPYHTLGIMKYKSLGIPYPLEGTDSPSAERIQNAKAILECEKYDGWKL